MEEAGMLDGDLITHLNGEGVGAGDSAAEDFVWESKVRFYEEAENTGVFASRLKMKVAAFRASLAQGIYRKNTSFQLSSNPSRFCQVRTGREFDI